MKRNLKSIIHFLMVYKEYMIVAKKYLIQTKQCEFKKGKKN